MKNIIKKAYDNLAPEYLHMRKNGGVSYFFNEMLEMPTTLKLLGDVRGKKILDLGCGPGRYSKILTSKGAKVIGIDNSKTSIDLARLEAPNAEFLVGDIEKLPFANGEFDVVISTLVIGHLESWKRVLSEANRVLKKDGIFVFSIHNPIKEVMEKEIWKGRKFRVIKNYFKEKSIIDTWGIGKNRFKVSHHHKTYGTIIRNIVGAGFEIIDYEDSYPLKKSKKDYPEDYEMTSNIPQFCSWKVKKK